MIRHFGKSVLLLLAAISITGFVSCSSDSNLEKEVLELCKYIPDHGLREGADKYLTEDYFRAYSEAIDAPTGGLIGDEEFLYYFVGGQDGDPIFSFKGITKTEDNILAEVYVQPGYNGVPMEGTEQSLHVLKIVTVEENGSPRYLLDDFDSTKQQCIDFVKAVRSSYKSGEFEKNLIEYGADADEIDSFRKELEDFYTKYGE